METPHKHHIVQDYKCIELGLTTSYKIGGKEFYFKENVVEVSPNQHALIHWGYKCNDLSPLLEVCNPPQWVIDMISLGDNRDSGAASILALGEIEGIDTSGKNHPQWGKKSNFYKDGRTGEPGSIERKNYNRRKIAISQGKPKEKHGGLSYRQVYYRDNKERLDDIMKRIAKEWTCIKRIEKLIIEINNDWKRFGYLDLEILAYISFEIDHILCYMEKNNVNPELIMSYNLFDRY